MRHATPVLVALLALPCAHAQSNTLPGMDIRAVGIDDLQALGRMGTFPNGTNGLAFRTRVCNVGTVALPWLAPMDPRHPFFAYLFCRERNGRFEQISDRSYVKHGLNAANQALCSPCVGVQGELTPSCSDTYSANTNGNRFGLGPAQEVDPWLGVWDPVGSHFDAGEPNVGPGQNMDGQRSLTQAQVGALNPVTHRMEVDDAELNQPGSRFFFASQLVALGEAEALRADSSIAREATATWNGSSWTFAPIGDGGVLGSILQFWSGSTLDSSANGTDDGRFYVAVSVTGPDNRGLWHYEYAVHNRDNSRGAASLRIPICPTARVLNPTFRDIDTNASNDWTLSLTSGEAGFLAGAANALEWNSIYNFGFDSDAAPVAGQVTLDQALPGAGAGAVTVNSRVPGALFHEYVGDGCGTPAPTLSTFGTPSNAAIPNPSFGVRMVDVQPGGTTLFFFSGLAVNNNLGNGCTLFAGAPIAHSGPQVADPTGMASFPLPIPNIPELEGGDVICQGLEIVLGGPLFGTIAFSNGIRVRVGNQRTNCP